MDNHSHLFGEFYRLKFIQDNYLAGKADDFILALYFK